MNYLYRSHFDNQPTQACPKCDDVVVFKDLSRACRYCSPLCLKCTIGWKECLCEDDDFERKIHPKIRFSTQE